MNTRLSQREKELICLALDEALATDKLLKHLKYEYDLIKDKLTYAVSSHGNRLRHGFSFAGCNGSELNIFAKLRKEGYDELYYSAPYHWAVVHIADRKIYTYTEGDTCLTECHSARSFKAELRDHWQFMLDNHPSALDGDSVATLNRANRAGLSTGKAPKNSAHPYKSRAGETRPMRRCKRTRIHKTLEHEDDY